MGSYIEEADIDEGHYTLEIIIPRATLLPSKEFATCVNFDLAIEFVHKNARPGATAAELASHAALPGTASDPASRQEELQLHDCQSGNCSWTD